MSTLMLCVPGVSGINADPYLDAQKQMSIVFNGVFFPISNQSHSVYIIFSSKYPLITSLPRKSTPYTDRAMRGQPKTFVVLKDRSMGKFQMMGSIGREGLRQAV